MDWQVHSEATGDFLELPESERKLVKESIELRKGRENPLTSQRGTGISYDNHGEPIHYFKVEAEKKYRVFFDIRGNRVILLGIRERDDETYINLREYTKRV